MGELKKKALHGAIWNTIQSLSNKGLSFLFLILMTRLLTPEDYGMVGMLAVFMVIADAFIDCGFGQAIVRKLNRTVLDESTVFYFNIVASTCCYLLLFAIAPIVADFYQMPDLCPLLRVLGLRLIIGAFATIHVLKYSIGLNFKTPSFVNISANLLSGVFGLWMAYTGYGVWALAGQQVSRQLFLAIIYNVVSRWRPIWGFSWETFREMFSFGSKLLGQRLLNAIYSNISVIFIGKAYSAVDLGLYSKGNEMADYPSGTAYGVINTVSYPLLCQLQNDRDRLTLAYRKLVRVVAFVVCPIMTFIFFFATPLMVSVLGEQWEKSGWYLMLLCYPYMFIPLLCLNQTLLQVVGRTDLILRLEIISKMLGVTMLSICLPISIDAMCFGAIINTVLCYFLNTYYTSRFIDLTLRQQFGDLVRSLLYSALIGGIAYMSTMGIDNLWFKIIIGLSVGCVLYVGIAAICRMREFGECIDLIKNRK